MSEQVEELNDNTHETAVQDDAPADAQAAAPGTAAKSTAPATAQLDSKKSIDMSAHFSKRQLIKYSLPSIATMVFTSIYGIVDGFFVSNFAGETAFAAVNFIMPFIMILSSAGFMVGTGGSAIIATTHGEGDLPRANKYFGMLIVFTFVIGLIFAVVGFVFSRPLAQALGATGDMLSISELYARISMISLPFYMLQYLFQAFFNTAGKPKIGFRVTVIAGCLNIVLDALLVGVLGYGVAGAAAATVCSEIVGGVVPVIYFARKNPTPYRLRLHWPNATIIAKTCINGSSEMVTNIAMSIVAMVYNVQLLRFIGENGVAAYGVLMYVGMIFGAVFMGYVVAVAPLMSFQNGAQNNTEKRSLLKKSLLIIAGFSVLMLVAGEALANPFSYLFTSYNPELCELTMSAFHVYSLSFLFMGISIYGSSFFTSLENGLVSAIISFVRTFVFELGAVLIIPEIFGAEYIWFSFLVAELAAAILSASLMAALSRKYGFRD